MNNLTESHCCYWKVLKGLDWAIELYCTKDCKTTALQSTIVYTIQCACLGVHAHSGATCLRQFKPTSSSCSFHGGLMIIVYIVVSISVAQLKYPLFPDLTDILITQNLMHGYQSHLLQFQFITDHDFKRNFITVLHSFISKVNFGIYTIKNYLKK